MIALLNKFFGWEYVAVPWGDGVIVRRAIRYPSGAVIISCFNTELALDTDTMMAGGRKVIWLTKPKEQT